MLYDVKIVDSFVQRRLLFGRGTGINGFLSFLLMFHQQIKGSPIVF